MRGQRVGSDDEGLDLRLHRRAGNHRIDGIGNRGAGSKGERHTGGRKLADEAAAAVMRGAGSATVVTDGPFGETKEIISGFFTIEADDLAHAVKLCGDHPHLDGGTIEIRQVDELAGCAGETAEARSGEATR